MFFSLAAAANIATTPVYILGIVLMVLSVALVAIILKQSGKDKGLGTLGGSAETYFGKKNSNSKEALLSKLTIALSVAIVVIVIVMVILINKAA